MSDQSHPTPDRDQPQIYVIRIQGHLGQMWTERFEHMTITQDRHGDTLLTGLVADQAMLYKILRQIRDLGLPLIAVNRLPDDDVDIDS